MNRSEMIAVMQQFDAGIKIQQKVKSVDVGIRKWDDIDEPSFNFENYDYRAAPKELDFPTDDIVITFSVNEFGKIILSNNFYHEMKRGRIYSIPVNVEDIVVRKVKARHE